MGREEMRAADGDRQAVADKLRGALDEGRLDLHEYDERLQQAYAAKTYGRLDALLSDLPNVTPVPVPSGTAARTDRVTGPWLAQVWGGWASTVGLTTAVWLVSCLASGAVLYFWPLWIAGPWGLVLVWQTVGGLASGEPRKQAEARERKELARQRKREQKALRAEAAARGEQSPVEPVDLPAAPEHSSRHDPAA